MKSGTFWRVMVQDRSSFLDSLIANFREHGIRYCVIDGVAVNAYSTPVVTEDLDIVVAVEQVDLVPDLFTPPFKVERIPYRLNISLPDSKLRVQIQTNPFYIGFVERSRVLEVMDERMPVAAIDDLFAGKVRAFLTPTRRPSKRQKDLADIQRLIEVEPSLRSTLPEEVTRFLVA